MDKPTNGSDQEPGCTWWATAVDPRKRHPIPTDNSEGIRIRPFCSQEGGLTDLYAEELHTMVDWLSTLGTCADPSQEYCAMTSMKAILSTPHRDTALKDGNEHL